MSNAIATRNNGLTPGSYADIEAVLVGGDLARLTAEQRVSYYSRLCESLGLNPLSRPFDYLNLKGKLVLYAKKDCTEQLRRMRGVSIYKIEKERDGDIFMVTAYARDKEGREDQDLGSLSLAGLKGEDLSNAMMKAITKAKRRVTLSICGLAMPDESEIEAISYSRQAVVDDGGRIIDPGKVEYIEHRRPSDPPRDAPKHETIEGQLIHPKTADPATGRTAPIGRNEEPDPSFAPRTTDEEAKTAAALRKGIGDHKGWMVSRKLDPGDRELSLYLLNRAAGRLGFPDPDDPFSDNFKPWTSRKGLDTADWHRTSKKLQSLNPAELAQWVEDSAQHPGDYPNSGIEPCPACGRPDLYCLCTLEEVDEARARKANEEAEALTGTLMDVEADPVASGAFMH